jgi:N-acetylglucosaminyl-diphospho-decaprenol L-rhamnosyltransferase
MGGRARRPRRFRPSRQQPLVDLVIVIVSYNTRSDLENCLASLHDHPPSHSHEIVVVDNASSDGSIDRVKSRWPKVRVISMKGNVGFARANNEAIRQTMSELILLLNSDTVVRERSIDALVGALHELPGASIVGPRLRDASGIPELSFGPMMSPFGELRQKALMKFASRNWIAEMTSRPRLVDWVSAACLLVRRRDAEEAGLFDERYFMYCEDVDFCAAVRARGGRVYFSPAADVVHLRGQSWVPARGGTRDARRRSQLAFYQKHHPAWAAFLRLYLRLRGKLRGKKADT